MGDIKIYGNDLGIQIAEIEETYLSNQPDTKIIENQIWSLVLNQQNILICHGHKQLQQIENILHALPAFINKSTTGLKKPSVVMLSGLENCYDAIRNGLDGRKCSISRNSEDSVDVLFFDTSEVPKLTGESGFLDITF
jgi:hypothetical protein